MTTRDRIVEGRRTRATHVTFCDRCEEFIGIHRRSFNSSQKSRYSDGRSNRMAVHSGHDGKRCPNSSISVSPNVVFERGTA